jgi:hypothetical protein
MNEGRTGTVARKTTERVRRGAGVALVAGLAALGLAAVAPEGALAAAAAQGPAEPEALGTAAWPGEWGPFTTGNDFLLAAGFLAAHPGRTGALPDGAWEVEVGYGVANTFAKSRPFNDLFSSDKKRRALTLADLDAAAGGRDGLFYVDGEVSRSAVTVRRGLGRVEVEATIPILDVGGGYTDNLIEGFHSTFSLNQNGRRAVPRDVYTLYLRADGRRLYTTQGAGAGIGDVVLAAKSELAWSPAFLADIGFGQIAIQGLLKLPTGNPNDFYGTGSADAGIQLLSSRAVGRGRLDVTLAALALGAAPKLGTASQLVIAASVAYERPLFRATSVLAQLDLAQSPLRTVQHSALTPTTYLISVGLGHAFTQRLSGVVGLTENVLNYDNSADIAIRFGLRRRL